MKIDENLIDRLAELSKLEFNASEKVEIKDDLQKMLNFVQKLDEINTAGIPPLVFMSSEINRLREDVAVLEISKDEALKNAPKKDSDYFKVPKVIG